MSRIVSARADLINVPFVASLETAVATWRAHRFALVVLGDDAGCQGVGELPLDGSGWEDRLRQLEASLADLTGQAPADVIEARATTDRGQMVAGAAASAALDLIARQSGLPPWRVLLDRLGHGRPVVAPRDILVNALVGGRSADEAARSARDAVDQGFGTLKLKSWPDERPASLTGRLAAIRAAVGPAPRLRLDVNGAWSETEATERLRELSSVHLEYVEQPIGPAAGPLALARVRRSAATPIAADESASDLESVAQLLDSDAIDVLVLKPARLGGPLATLQAARLGSERGVRTVIATLFETGIGIAAGLQVAAALAAGGFDTLAHGLATAGLLADDLVTGLPTPAGGRLAVPVGPGLGVTLDPEAIERYRGD